MMFEHITKDHLSIDIVHLAIANTLVVMTVFYLFKNKF